MKLAMKIFMPDPRFPLGAIVLTSGVTGSVEKAEIAEAIFRHSQCDWGDIGPEDRAENEFSLKNGFRLFSAYTTEDEEQRFYVITEADRSATTVLMSREY